MIEENNSEENRSLFGECSNCRQELKDKVFCKNCYMSIQIGMVGKIMEGDIPIKISDSIRDIKWNLEDQISEIKLKLDNLENILKSLKERGFKIKK